MKNTFKRIPGLSGDRESSYLGKQRNVIFMITASALFILNILSVFTQPLLPVSMTSAVLTALVALLLCICYTLRRIPLRWALALLLIVAQLQNVVECVSYALHYTPELDLYIIADILTSILLVMASLVSYLRYSPTIVSALSLLTYCVILVEVSSPLLSGLFPFYLFILVAVILYDSLAVRTTLLIDEERANMTDEFTAFIQESGLTLDDIKGYSSLSRNFGASTEEVREILETMKPATRKNLLSSVSALLREDKSSTNQLRKVFPTFSETQLAIAQLIIQDEKLPEISRKLGKSESNISAQRSMIRNKLSLGPGDNLRMALLDALEKSVK